ncbi:MAG: AtpZ/AtpI family protein [Actinomycetota bacterium]
MAPDPQSRSSWSGMGTGWAITTEMIGSMLTLGGIGWLLDLVFGTDGVFVAIGVVLGAALGVYVVWLRYGRGDG